MPRAGGTGLAAPSAVFETWSESVSSLLESPDHTVLVMTMHPEVTGQGFVLRLLKRFIVWLESQPGITFSTMEAAAEGYRSLLRADAEQA